VGEYRKDRFNGSKSFLEEYKQGGFEYVRTEEEHV